MKRKGVKIAFPIIITALLFGILIYNFLTFDYLDTVHINPDKCRGRALYQELINNKDLFPKISKPNKEILTLLEENFTSDSGSIHIIDEAIHFSMYDSEPVINTTLENPCIDNEKLFDPLYIIPTFKDPQNPMKPVSDRKQEDLSIYDLSNNLLSENERSDAFKKLPYNFSFSFAGRNFYSVSIICRTQAICKYQVKSCGLSGLKNNLPLSIQISDNKFEEGKICDISFAPFCYVSSPANIVLNLIGGIPKDCGVIPAIPGKQMDTEKFSIKFLKAFPFSFSEVKSEPLTAFLFLADKKKKYLSLKNPYPESDKETYIFAVTPADINQYLEISAYDSAGNLLGNLASDPNHQSLIPFTLTNPGHKSIDHFKIGYKRSYEVRIPIEIPGLPKQNSNPNDLLDVKIPCLHLENIDSLNEAVANHLFMSYYPIINLPANFFPKTYQDTTMRDVLKDIRKAGKEKFILKIDYENGKISQEKEKAISIMAFGRYLKDKYFH